MKGVLTFHSETGTEGGAWAFQDDEFIGLPGPDHWCCTRCGRVWDKDTYENEPKPFFTYCHPDGYYRSSDEYLPDGDLGPDARSNAKGNKIAKQCQDEGHPEWERLYPNGMWSYEGLHILGDGDQLTVYDGDQVLFDGMVELPPRQDPYARDAYAAGGYLAAHRRPPIGTKEDWWFEEKHAVLVKAAP